MKIKAIVAVDNNWGIGYNNKLLFSIPEDKKFFAKITTNNYIVMGRKTFDSIGKILPNRINIVLSNTIKDNTKNLIYMTSNEYNKWLENNNSENKDCFIIGGESIYNKYYNICDEIYLTMVDKSFKADRYFPNLNNSDFKFNELLFKGFYNGMNYKITKWKK